MGAAERYGAIKGEAFQLAADAGAAVRAAEKANLDAGRPMRAPIKLVRAEKAAGAAYAAICKAQRRVREAGL